MIYLIHVLIIEYWIHRVLDTQSIGYTEYWIHRVLDTQSIGYTEYWIHRVLDTQSIGYTEYWIHSIEYTEYWIHRVLDTQSIGYTEHWIHRALNTYIKYWLNVLSVFSSRPTWIPLKSFSTSLKSRSSTRIGCSCSSIESWGRCYEIEYNCKK
jgi:hypothetical protein